ncbi:MAG: hypothetical protein IPM53_20780 [Anaerolineaceae bacterium]|nr:hypothetical protein [Anaerolineaceae bacterium]
MHTKLALKTKLKVNQQQIITSKLLQASGTDIAQLINRELIENPALERVDKDGFPDQTQKIGSLLPIERSLSVPKHSNSRLSFSSSYATHDPIDNLPMQVSAIDQLVAQARLMVDHCFLDHTIYLLHSLDQHGYLRKSQEELAAEMGVEIEVVEHVVQVLHQMDPPGIGAQDLKECLLIQCRHLNSNGTDCHVAQRMIAEVWEDLINHRWKRISKVLGVSQQEINLARRIISQHLYPYPLLLIKDLSPTIDSLNYADLIIKKGTKNDDFSYLIDISQINAFELQVSPNFILALENSHANKSGGEHQFWLQNSIERARLFIAALNQRWVTLQRIGEYLVAYQADFIERGPGYIKPLTRSKVAAALELHESTVGRAVSNKVAQLPNGRLIPFSQFFDDSLAAKEAIRQLLNSTEKLLSDREIADRLEAYGVKLARRTVTKYRQQLSKSSVHRQQNYGVLNGLVEAT